MTLGSVLISLRMSRIVVKWDMTAHLDTAGITRRLPRVLWGCVSTCVRADILRLSICASITILIRSIAGHLEINVMLRIKKCVKMGHVYNVMSVMGRFK